SAVDETATRRRPGRLHSLLQTPSNQSLFSFFLFLFCYVRVSVIERTPVQPYQRSQLRQATQPGEPARPADHRQASSLEGTQTTRPTSLAAFFFSSPFHFPPCRPRDVAAASTSRRRRRRERLAASKAKRKTRSCRCRARRFLPLAGRGGSSLLPGKETARQASTQATGNPPTRDSLARLLASLACATRQRCLPRRGTTLNAPLRLRSSRRRRRKAQKSRGRSEQKRKVNRIAGLRNVRIINDRRTARRRATEKPRK
ncbi:unnamed protein product, partial [Ixodes pacificus]